MSGPVVLHGGGEFEAGDEPCLEAMLELAARHAGGRRAAQISVVPTAAARYTPDASAAHGVGAFERVAAQAGLSVVASPAMIVDAVSAADADIAAQLAAADLVYFTGGDPDRIVLVGSSAGAVHIATYLQLRPRPSASEVRGAVLLSGLYGLTPLESVDRLYFGDGDQAIPKPSLLEAVAGSAPPVFVACAEFDPPRFQREAVALLERTLRARGRLPRTHFASGHNHYTLAMHLGTSDTRLADELLDFARACCAGESSRLPSRPIEERQTS
jgi:triacylglycerol lipase